MRCQKNNQTNKPKLTKYIKFYLLIFLLNKIYFKIFMNAPNGDKRFQVFLFDIDDFHTDQLDP